jgi:superfamily II DNA or RNA helicase
MKLVKKVMNTLKVSSGITLTNLNETDTSHIKGKLTFDNPAYLSAKKYAKHGYISISPFLTYYKESKGQIKVPIGFDVFSVIEDSSKFKIVDERVFPQVKYPPFVLQLREDQEKAAKNFMTMNDTMMMNGIVQLPTGKGKSILGLYVASQLSCKTLVVVHKNDLVLGWNNDIKLAFNNRVKPGLIKEKKRIIGDQITIATVQTLSRLSQYELENLFDTFGLVIQDEMHHCPASSYEVVSDFKAKYRLGLSATPERDDGLTHIMHLYYGGFCYRYKAKVDEKDILPVHVKKRVFSLYYNPVYEEYTSNGKVKYRLIDEFAPKDYEVKNTQKRLSDIPFEVRPRIEYHYIDDLAVANEEFMEFVCDDIVSEFLGGSNSVVFFSQKEHIRKYEEWLSLIVGAENVQTFYGDSAEKDSDIIERAESGEVRITLSTYSKGTEGTNVRSWDTTFLVSSINNEKNTEQAVGRVRRVKEGKRSYALVYDYRSPEVYAMGGHGHTRDRRYKKLGFEIEGQKERSNNPRKRNIFGRGYN